MAGGVRATVFYENGTAMVQFPDGQVMSLAEANSYFYPNQTFDPQTGQDMMLPSKDQEASTPRPDTLGDVASGYGNQELSAAKYLLENAGGVAAQALPEQLGVLRNVASYPADLVNAGLLAGAGASRKGLAYLGEIIPGNEQRAARDFNALLDLPVAAGAATRQAVSLADPAMNYVKNALFNRGLLR